MMSKIHDMKSTMFIYIDMEMNMNFTFRLIPVFFTQNRNFMWQYDTYKQMERQTERVNRARVQR